MPVSGDAPGCSLRELVERWTAQIADAALTAAQDGRLDAGLANAVLRGLELAWRIDVGAGSQSEDDDALVATLKARQAARVERCALSLVTEQEDSDVAEKA
jgi:hypothetical protein